MSIFHGEDGFFGLTKGSGGLQHLNFFIFNEKQHPKNIWFYGCSCSLNMIMLRVKKLPLDEECQDQIQWNGHFLFQGHCEQIQ